MCTKPIENIYSFTHLEIWGLKLRKVKQLSQSYIASRWTRCFSNLDLCHYRALGLFPWVPSPLLQFWNSFLGKGAVSYHRCSGEKVAYLSCPRQLQAFCLFIYPHHCHSISHCSLALPKKKKVTLLLRFCFQNEHRATLLIRTHFIPRKTSQMQRVAGGIAMRSLGKTRKIEYQASGRLRL